MAASSPFSATTKPHSHFSTHFNFTTTRTTHFNLRKYIPYSNRYSSTSFVVTNVLTNPHHKLQQTSTQDGVGDALDIFVPDSTSVSSSIKYHAEMTPSFAPEKFELPKAFYATAESVRDMLLIVNWNATYKYYEKMNVKQAYYLSMEFLQGRALLNSIGNLELSGAYVRQSFLRDKAWT